MILRFFSILQELIVDIMGFPGMYGGVVSVMIINTVLSLAAMKDAVSSAIHQAVRRGGQDEPPPERSDPSTNNHPVVDVDYAGDIRTYMDEIRQTLPVVVFNPLEAGFASKPDAQCAVCLCEFTDGEEVRQLPHCDHIYHRGCLDRWLDHHHTTCPLCRASLVIEELAKKQRQREDELAMELTVWFSSYHALGLRGPWWHPHNRDSGSAGSGLDYVQWMH